MKKATLHLGLDVHRESIMIAVAESGSKGEVRLYGEISHDLHALRRRREKNLHKQAAVFVYQLTPIPPTYLVSF